MGRIVLRPSGTNTLVIDLVADKNQQQVEALVD